MKYICKTPHSIVDGDVTIQEDGQLPVITNVIATITGEKLMDSCYLYSLANTFNERFFLDYKVDAVDKYCISPYHENEILDSARLNGIIPDVYITSQLVRNLCSDEQQYLSWTDCYAFMEYVAPKEEYVIPWLVSGVVSKPNGSHVMHRFLVVACDGLYYVVDSSSIIVMAYTPEEFIQTCQLRFVGLNCISNFNNRKDNTVWMPERDNFLHILGTLGS